MREQIEHLLANLLGIVPVLEHVACREVVPDFVEVFHQLVGVLVGLEFLGHLGQRCRFQHIDDEHRVMSGQRASTLGDDVRVGQVVFVGCLYEGVDAVVDVFLYAVVHRALTRGRSCAIVVDAESATAVDKVDVVSHLMQLNVELRGLAQGGLYTANLRNLRADVEVDEAQTVAHALLVEHFQGFEQLGTGQSELRGIAAALFPLTATARCQLDTNADVRAYTQLLCFASDELKLVHLLHDDENLLAHLLSE